MDTEPRALTQGGHGAQASHRLHGRKRGPKAAKPTSRCYERKEASILHLPTVKPHLREEATEILSALGRISRLVTNSPPLTRARPRPSPGGKSQLREAQLTGARTWARGPLAATTAPGGSWAEGLPHPRSDQQSCVSQPPPHFQLHHRALPLREGGGHLGTAERCWPSWSLYSAILHTHTQALHTQALPQPGLPGDAAAALPGADFVSFAHLCQQGHGPP